MSHLSQADTPYNRSIAPNLPIEISHADRKSQEHGPEIQQSDGVDQTRPFDLLAALAYLKRVGILNLAIRLRAEDLRLMTIVGPSVDDRVGVAVETKSPEVSNNALLNVSNQ